jgi:hypothetical protein
MNLKQRYVLKGINKSQTIDSVVSIQTSEDGSRILKVQDKWNGELPDSSVRNVSGVLQLLNPFWWANYAFAWTWWIWSWFWWTWPWMVGLVALL